MDVEEPLSVTVGLAHVRVWLLPAFALGRLFTVTVTVCGVPGQLPTLDVGVTVYTTVWEVAVVLVRVLLIVPVL